MSHLKAKSALSLWLFPFILFDNLDHRGEASAVIKRTEKNNSLTARLLQYFLLPLLLSPVVAWSESESTKTSIIPSAERQEALIHLLKQDCGSCHGMTLKGGLGPSLLPQALADKPDYVLVGTILYGRETLAMPAWDGILNKSEVEWLVAQLKEGISE